MVVYMYIKIESYRNTDTLHEAIITRSNRELKQAI
jgi:hypothetical protein